MHKFFVDNNQIDNANIEIINEDYNHIVKVLRGKIEDILIISDKSNAKTFNCKIEQITKNKVVCSIIEENKKNTEMNIKVDVYQGLPKIDKMEYIIQKSVELGVNEIIPVNMKYCIAKINNEDKKITRWNKISEVAAKQSKRNIIPKVSKPINVNELYNKIKAYDLAIVAYENEDRKTIKEIFESKKNVKNIAVVIGPEGGISKEEIEKLQHAGAEIVSLGNRILRTETAPIAVLSMIIYEYEF